MFMQVENVKHPTKVTPQNKLKLCYARISIVSSQRFIIGIHVFIHIALFTIYII